MLQQLTEAETPSAHIQQDNEVAVSTSVTQWEPQRIELLLAEIKRTRPKWKHRFSLLIGFVYAIHSFNFGFTGLFDLMVGMGFASAIEWILTYRDKELMEQLAQCDDKRAVGPLLDALRYEDASPFTAITAALIRLLPKLRASDRHLLTTDQRSVLNEILGGRILRFAPVRQHSILDKLLGKTLGTSERSHLLLAILEALSQIGDAQAIASVRKLADGSGSGKNALIREAAIDCLPFLEEIVRQEEAQSTLLRAAETAISAEGLLLPAAHGTDNHADQLLRANGADASD